MNFKQLIFTLLFVSAPLSAMKLEPGTVIDPLCLNPGQFTVSIPEKFSSVPSGLPTAVSQVSKAGSDIFKNKGIPVIISTAVGMVPMWALTTGTGYLLIGPCAFDSSLLTPVASGAFYFLGEQSNSVLKKYINNPYFKSLSQIALCASCLGASYLTGNPLISDTLFATGNAIGLQTILDNCSSLFAQLKPTPVPTYESQTWYALSPTVKAHILEGTINALSILVPSLCTTNVCDPNIMLRILLYEQAYRLAQCGCIAAQLFINK